MTSWKRFAKLFIYLFCLCSPPRNSALMNNYPLVSEGGDSLFAWNCLAILIRGFAIMTVTVTWSIRDLTALDERYSITPPHIFGTHVHNRPQMNNGGHTDPLTISVAYVISCLQPHICEWPIHNSFPYFEGHLSYLVHMIIRDASLSKW